MVWASAKGSGSKWRKDPFHLFLCIVENFQEQKLSNHKLKEVFKKVFLDWDRISLNGQAYNV